MAHPKAYSPEPGQMYQILCRQGREWDHCDYAKDKTEKNYLLGEYRLAYHGFEFKTILLPAKYWPKKNKAPPQVPVAVAIEETLTLADDERKAVQQAAATTGENHND